MVSDEPVLGQGHEVINISVYSNTSQVLKRHYYMNAQGNFDHDIADFILKKGDYTNTYIAIETEGIPDGVTLKLVDENSYQLYSPVDANNNWITTACSITVGESDIIPLPAQFNNQLSSHVPFAAGTYNWKLIFTGNDAYEEEEISLAIEIRDFKVWDIITPEIFPNDDIKVKIKTYADTYYPFPNGTIEIDNHNPSISEYFNQGIGVLTTHATYDNSTGIITYPNQDITDLSIGKHIQVINQNSNCFIDYEVKNPIEFYYYGDDTYGSNRDIGYITRATSLVSDRITPVTNITINGATIPWNNYGGSTSPRAVYNRYTNKKYFPPGTYHCVVNAPIATNQQQYTCEGTFEVSTENCELKMGYNYTDELIYTIYVYNDTTPIPNATIKLIDIETNTTLETQTTNNNGVIIWNNQNVKNYKSIAINVDNTNLLESESLYDSITLESNKDIIQSNENLILTAQLKDSYNTNIKGATINFYIDDE